MPVFFENCSAFRETIQSTREDYIGICQTIQENIGILAKSYEIMMTPDQAEWLCEKKSYNITYLDEFLTRRDQCELIPVSCRSTEPFAGNLQLMLNSTQELASKGYKTILVTESEGKKARLQALQAEGRLHAAIELLVSRYGLSEGFICDDICFAILTDSSLFQKERAAARKKLMRETDLQFYRNRTGRPCCSRCPWRGPI